jgi:DNA-directed RNA polymerase subunit RPC12/RpoP
MVRLLLSISSPHLPPYHCFKGNCLFIFPFNSYKAIDRSLILSERNREEEEEEEEMTNNKISYLCSRCGKTFAGKQSALNHAKDYHKSKNSKEFVDQLMQEEW